jgi:hypothetical protein
MYNKSIKKMSVIIPAKLKNKNKKRDDSSSDDSSDSSSDCSSSDNSDRPKLIAKNKKIVKK